MVILVLTSYRNRKVLGIFSLSSYAIQVVLRKPLFCLDNLNLHFLMLFGDIALYALRELKFRMFCIFF